MDGAVPTTEVPNFSQQISHVLLKLVELPKFLLPGHPGGSLNRVPREVIRALSLAGLKEELEKIFSPMVSL